MGKHGILVLIVLLGFTGCKPGAEKPAPTTAGEKAAYALLERILPGYSDQFVFKETATADGKDFFEISSTLPGILIEGNNGVAFAAGLNWYLKNYCSAQVSINYHQLQVPEALPKVEGKTRVETPFDYRYFFNYCTFGYTMPWWDWERWEQMIDYMALMGVNMPLAMIGQEAVWQEVFIDLGMSEQQIQDFFVGPAHLPWGWMGNIDGLGGPLPQNWIDQRKALQKKILKRMRELGMKPVLQAFTGHVPVALKELYPSANIFQIHDWAGIPGTWFLDPTDSLFQKIGTAFIKKQTEMFGTDHLYDADCFIEVDPPSGDPEFLAKVSRNVYNSMAEADPKATWVLQGWFFFFRKNFWTPERGRAFLEAVPKNKVIVLDLYGEKNPTWDKTEAFYGQPWIWNVICNQDQKVNMSGDLAAMQANFTTAFESEINNNLRGIGVIPEGLGYNPVVQDFIFEKAWDQSRVDLEEWISKYAIRRYGADNEKAVEAWKGLLQSVYDRTRTMWSPLITTPRPIRFDEVKEDIRHQRRDFVITPEDPFAWDYKPEKLAKAAELLLQSAGELGHIDTYRFDLTNIYRELLSSLTHRFINELTVAYQEKDTDRFERAAETLRKLILDLDEITGTNEHFLLGKWLEDAKSWAKNDEEKAYYEWNARTIITIWQPWKEGYLRDYASKQWSGLFTGYFLPRWELLFEHMRTALATGKDFDPKKYDLEVRALDYEWTRSHETYPSVPQGDIIAVAKKMKEEYGHYFGI